MVGTENTDENARLHSCKNRALSRQQVDNIVRRPAKRAGMEKNVSTPWLRHTQANHVLDRGAPVHVLQQTLGYADLSTTGRYARPAG